MPANNRFSDNPFRDPNLSPEQVERIEKRNEALRIYRETGDRGPAVEAGLFPSKPETSMNYKGTTFTLSRPISDGPTVDMSLVCEHHKHDVFTISTIETTGKWGLGRKATGGKTYNGTFNGAIRRCADLLVRECKAVTEVDRFFEQSTIFCTLENDEPTSFQQINLDALEPRKSVKTEEASENDKSAKTADDTRE